MGAELRGFLQASLLLLLVSAAGPAAAHEVRPGYLEIRETAPDRFRVLWKVPRRGELRLAVEPSLPAACRDQGPRTSRDVSGAVITRWAVRCEGGLVGGTLAVEGLGGVLDDVLVRFEPLEGAAQTWRLSPGAPARAVSAAPGRGAIARTYLALGVEHILGGIDHLLFILSLLLLVQGWRRLLWTVTAFTVAHSIALALATLGLVHVPPAPVEAVIALSIVFVAAEIVHGRQGRPGVTARRPWIVAFTFGLLHGLGFAGALSEVGLPGDAVPLALFLFNVGVEAGQLLFVAAVLALLAAGRRLAIPWPVWGWRVTTYAIGSVAALWTIERVAGLR